jgi:ATP-binding cassette, subfamily F, member 3
MILLSTTDIRKYFGPEPVLDGVSFAMRPGEKVALVGPNGAGKTTLLKVLAGREEADAGRVERHSTLRMGFLEQHADFSSGRTVWQ